MKSSSCTPRLSAMGTPPHYSQVHMHVPHYTKIVHFNNTSPEIRVIPHGMETWRDSDKAEDAPEEDNPNAAILWKKCTIWPLLKRSKKLLNTLAINIRGPHTSSLHALLLPVFGHYCIDNQPILSTRLSISPLLSALRQHLRGLMFHCNGYQTMDLQGCRGLSAL
jgi:hypothetical protein